MCGWFNQMAAAATFLFNINGSAPLLYGDAIIATYGFNDRSVKQNKRMAGTEAIELHLGHLGAQLIAHLWMIVFVIAHLWMLVFVIATSR